MQKALLGPVLYGKVGLLRTYAAALAFYFLLSLVPFLIVSATLINYLSPVDLTQQFNSMLAEILPPSSGMDATSIVEAVKAASGQGAQTVGFVLAVWTSTNFMDLLFAALHHIFDIERGEIPSGIIAKLKSLVLLFIWMNTLVLTAFSFVLTLLMEKDLASIFLSPWFASNTGRLTRDMFVFATLLIAFALTYLVVHTRDVSARLLIQGATIAACGWLGISYLFAYVLPIVWKINVLYGAMGSIIATLFWAYSSTWAVLLGACWIARFSLEWE